MSLIPGGVTDYFNILLIIAACDICIFLSQVGDKHSIQYTYTSTTLPAAQHLGPPHPGWAKLTPESWKKIGKPPANTSTGILGARLLCKAAAAAE